ncbi:tRNA cytidylyltransferase [Alicyclobacillus fructus]|uniref:tRNA cytidylyltransferase n=1 Tax=Alicyclobacillus fructus TaxID=2816082 RepID=UPI001A8F5B3B|nr:tRNA cytidylyltransferase [Alicyclobacillus fructus]
METLERAGHRAYLVGGAVRDLLLGSTPFDLDVATSARPEEVKSLFGRTIDTGVRHGTVSVHVAGRWIEVTTFRTEGPYGDGRRPDYVHYVDDVQADLARRDFTINAMALDARGQLIDPFDGRGDLSRRVLRAVGDPAARFREDGLRLVRAVRFLVQFDLTCDPATEAALFDTADAIRPIAWQRIGKELERLAHAPWHEHLEWLTSVPLWQQKGEPLAWLAEGWTWLAAQGPFTVAPPKGWPSVALWFVGVDDAPARARAFAEAMAYGKDVGRRVEGAVRLVQAWLRGEDALSPERLYDAGRASCLMAVAMVPFLVRGDVFETARWKRAVAAQPLWDRSHLALSARELIAMGLSGEEIGRCQQNLVRRILRGEIENEPDALRREVMARWKGCDGHG